MITQAKVAPHNISASSNIKVDQIMNKQNFLKTSIYIIFLFGCLSMAQPVLSEILLEVKTPIGDCVAYRPDFEEIQNTAALAKAIFVEAFSTSYTHYHRHSGSVDAIEKWLRLSEGLTLETWLSKTFDGEYNECLSGKKSFIYLRDANQKLIGWLSHSPVSEEGDVYLSQCSLEADSRYKKVATTIFAETFKKELIQNIFPGVKELKLIARKINKIACQLYEKAEFERDDKIDPHVYGDDYDDRYVGFRKVVG